MEQRVEQRVERVVERMADGGAGWRSGWRSRGEVREMHFTTRFGEMVHRAYPRGAYAEPGRMIWAIDLPIKITHLTSDVAPLTRRAGAGLREKA